jgi:hypothetical protein
MDNLTTACEFLRFNKESTKLSACSKWKKHALKIVRKFFYQFFKKFFY